MDDSGPEVHGFVFGSKELDRHWKRLDDFEGDEYRRVLAPVRLSGGGGCGEKGGSGETVRAYVYALRRASGG